MSTAIERLIAAEELPSDYREVAERHWRPLSEDIAERYTGRPLIVGVNGAQGSGKTTLCRFLEALMLEHNQRAVTLSLDDLYLPRAEGAPVPFGYFTIAGWQALRFDQPLDCRAHAIRSGSGSPRAKASTLTSAFMPMAMRVSALALPRCGRRTTFSSASRGSGTCGSCG